VKSARAKPAARRTPELDIASLRARLADAQEALRAIQSGEVDTLVVSGKKGPHVFTLQGADRAYRLLIESMNEGALTLTTDKTIIYANESFAKMVGRPLKQVMGSSFREYLSEGDQTLLRSHIKRSVRAGSKILVSLHAVDRSQMPVQISIRRTASKGMDSATIGMVVTDLTEARRIEDLLRALTHRVVKIQEDERGRLASELHDGVTQLLCGILLRSQALVATLSSNHGPAKSEAKKLRDMAGRVAKDLERISHNLRPSVLDQLGLVPALRNASVEFEDRTGVSVKLVCAELTMRLTTDGELTLYRILQEALRNVEKHARASQVTVDLSQPDVFVQLVIRDNGVGFDPNNFRSRQKVRGGLGLLGMRERANYAGGALELKSGPSSGTEIMVRIPLPRTG
jgi:PAS domain S-box-containing protein